MTTDTTQGHRPSSESKRNHIILSINGIKNKLEEIKLLIHDTHADIITIQVTKLTPIAQTPKVHNFTTVRNDRLHKQEVGSLHSLETTLHSLQQTYLLPSIHKKTEPQMVKVHRNNTKHITIYIPPLDSTSTHYHDSLHRHTTLHAVHHEHTTLSPHRRCERTFHYMALVH